MNRCIAWAMTILLLIAPTALAGSAADDLASAEVEYQALLKSEKRTSTKSLWTQVISRFEDVVDDHPDSPEAPRALFRQGELYIEMFTYSITLGELLKAEKAFRRVIAGYPDHELADESRKKLEEIEELRTKNCLVRVTPETNLAELLVPEESETAGDTETEAGEPSKKESFWGKRKNKKEEEPAETDSPNPKENETPDDPIETIIAEATPPPETAAPEEIAPLPETPPETISEKTPSPKPEVSTEPETTVSEDFLPEPISTDVDNANSEPVIVVDAPASPDDTDESFGIGSLEPEPETTHPVSDAPEPILLPVSALPEPENNGDVSGNNTAIYGTSTPVYTEGLPRPTTIPPVSADTGSESPSTPVNSLYSEYQEKNGGTRMLTPAAPLTSTTSITGIRYFTDTDHTRIVLDTDNAAALFDSRLPENNDRGLPPRVYIDVFGADLALDRTGPIDIDDGFVHAIRWSQYNTETVRVVMDLETPRDYRIFALSDPNRVVIDILH